MRSDKHSVSDFKSKASKVWGNYHLGLHEGWMDTQDSQDCWVIQGAVRPAPTKDSCGAKGCSFLPSSSGWSRGASVYFYFL